MLSHVLLFCDPMDCSPPASLSVGFPRQEYWSGLPFPSPGDLLDPGIEPVSPAFASRFFTTEPLKKPRDNFRVFQNQPQRKKLANILYLRRVMQNQERWKPPKGQYYHEHPFKKFKMWYNTACLHSYWTMGIGMQLYSAMYGLCCT